jgi:hypothetical protein
VRALGLLGLVARLALLVATRSGGGGVAMAVAAVSGGAPSAGAAPATLPQTVQ